MPILRALPKPSWRRCTILTSASSSSAMMKWAIWICASLMPSLLGWTRISCAMNCAKTPPVSSNTSPRGGTLIVLRQGYEYAAPELVPYPLHYNQPNDEVTFEDAPVTRLQPDHTLLKLPNVIRDEDFAGWVKDRGNFFLGSWDPRYRPLLACNDPGEAPKPGGLVIANYGKGLYLYSAYSLFRQLPAGVPGAFRLFANLLAQPIARILEWAALLKYVSIFAF